MDSIDKALMHLQEVRKVCDRNYNECTKCPFIEFCNYLENQFSLGGLIRIVYRNKGLIGEDSLT